MAQAGQKSTEIKRTLSLSKGAHEYVFKYAAGDEGVVLDALSNLARRRDVAFDWFDAAVLSHQLGEHLSQEIQALLPKK